MELQISRALEEAHTRDTDPNTRASRDLAGAIVLDRAAQAVHRGLSALIDQLVQAATIEQRQRLPVVEFQVRRSLDDLEAKAKDLDPKLRVLFVDQLQRIRKVSLGPDAALAIRESITPYDLPPRDRLGTIASVHEDTSSSAACATITVTKLDVSKFDQTRSAVAGSS